MKKFKPIRLIADRRLKPKQIILSIGAIDHFLKIAGVTDLIDVSIHDLVNIDFLDLGSNKKDLVDGRAILGYLSVEDIKSNREFINFLIVRDCLLMNIDTNKIVQGFAIKNYFGAAAVGREENIVITYMVVLHELGEIYGVPFKDRDDKDLVMALENHCPNDCVMYPGGSVLARIDLVNKPFCDKCLADLHKVFKKKNLK